MNERPPMITGVPEDLQSTTEGVEQSAAAIEINEVPTESTIPVEFELGKAAVGEVVIDAVPGVERGEAPEDDQPRSVSLEDWKGGDPSRVVGYDGTVRR